MSPGSWPIRRYTESTRFERIPTARPRPPYPFSTGQGGVLSAPSTVAPAGSPSAFAWKKIVGGSAFCLVALAACVLVARRLTNASWPLDGAEPGLVVAAGGAYLAALGFRALGWRQVFRRDQRPDSSGCLAACGMGSASGSVLPFRLDYVVKIGTLRRLGGVNLGLDTVVLSIVALGVVDGVALLPLAIFALATAGTVFLAPMAVVVLFCLGCLGVLVAGPRLVRIPLVHRSKHAATVCERVAVTSAAGRSTLGAGTMLFACWIARICGGTFLLMALGAGFSPLFVLVVLCMAGLMSMLPITAGGGVATIGATAAVLLALGVSKDIAINFSLASGLLAATAALTAVLVGVTGSLALALSRRGAGARLVPLARIGG
jgi:uncharacterized membrane protein YbhN (UPF0104 family)